MSDNTAQVPDGANSPIPLLEPGGKLTLLSASLGNALIRTANATRNMKGVNGCRVTLSDDVIIVDPYGDGSAPAATPPASTPNLPVMPAAVKCIVVSENANTINCRGPVYFVNITETGNNYVSPTVSFTGGGGSGAAGTAVVSSGQIVGVELTSNGSGYTSAPTVSFTDLSGTGAAATALVPTTVGKPAELQGAVATQSVTNNGVTDTQYIWPDYASGDVIVALIDTAGGDYSLQDVNRAGRVWATVFPTCEVVSGVSTAMYRVFASSPPYTTWPP
jgi:hypothetical protein